MQPSPPLAASRGTSLGMNYLVSPVLNNELKIRYSCHVAWGASAVVRGSDRQTALRGDTSRVLC